MQSLNHQCRNDAFPLALGGIGRTSLRLHDFCRETLAKSIVSRLSLMCFVLGPNRIPTIPFKVVPRASSGPSVLFFGGDPHAKQSATVGDVQRRGMS